MDNDSSNTTSQDTNSQGTHSQGTHSQGTSSPDSGAPVPAQQVHEEHPEHAPDFTAAIPTVDDLVALPEDQLDADDLDIPILTELHGADDEGPEGANTEDEVTQQQAPEQQPLFLDLPVPGSAEVEQIETIVENLVTEFLPRLEHELRIRLYDYVSGLAAARRHNKNSETD